MVQEFVRSAGQFPADRRREWQGIDNSALTPSREDASIIEWDERAVAQALQSQGGRVDAEPGRFADRLKPLVRPSRGPTSTGVAALAESGALPLYAASDRHRQRAEGHPRESAVPSQGGSGAGLSESEIAAREVASTASRPEFRSSIGWSPLLLSDVLRKLRGGAYAA